MKYLPNLPKLMTAVLVSALALVVLPAQSQAASAYFNPSQGFIDQTTFKVPVYVESTTAEPEIASVQLKIAYPASVKVVTVADGEFDSYLDKSDNPTARVISLNAVNNAGNYKSGQVRVASITFEAVSTSGQVALTIASDSEINGAGGEQLLTETINGAYTLDLGETEPAVGAPATNESTSGTESTTGADLKTGISQTGTYLLLSLGLLTLGVVSFNPNILRVSSADKILLLGSDTINMNSVQGYRGFITFAILSGIMLTGFVGFNYIAEPVSTTSEADSPKTDPLNLKVLNITEESSEITWATQDEVRSAVVYSTDFAAKCLSNINESTEDCLVQNEADKANNHSVKLTNLKPDTTYFFRIHTETSVYPLDSNSSFKTTEAIPLPIPAPEIIEEDNIETEEFDGIRGGLPPVLGVTTEVDAPIPVDPLSDVNSLISEEFREAMVYGDLRYDFNHDGDVTAGDYPLFIEFITNQED